MNLLIGIFSVHLLNKEHHVMLGYSARLQYNTYCTVWYVGDQHSTYVMLL